MVEYDSLASTFRLHSAKASVPQEASRQQYKDRCRRRLGSRAPHSHKYSKILMTFKLRTFVLFLSIRQQQHQINNLMSHDDQTERNVEVKGELYVKALFDIQGSNKIYEQRYL